MKMKPVLFASAAILAGSAAWAECTIEAGNVNILGNDFAPIHAVVDRAKSCTGGVAVDANLTTEHRDIQVAALTADPAQYTVAIVANSSIVPLMNEDLIRPLDDLIAKYPDRVADNQKISINGQVMAVAFMANAQHLFYRKDILDEVGAEVPTTYEEVIAVAQQIKDAGIMPNPFISNTKVEWNLGQEFVNMYLGHGGLSSSRARPWPRSTMKRA